MASYDERAHRDWTAASALRWSVALSMRALQRDKTRRFCLRARRAHQLLPAAEARSALRYACWSTTRTGRILE